MIRIALPTITTNTFGTVTVSDFNAVNSLALNGSAVALKSELGISQQITVSGSALAPGSSTTQDFTVTGAQTGQTVDMTPAGQLDSSWDFLSYYAYVSTADTVTVQVTNNGSQPGFNSGTFNVTVK